MQHSRRKFIDALLLGGLFGWLGSVLFPVFSFLKPPKIPEANVNAIKAGGVAEFEPGTGAIVKFGRTPVLLVRTEDGQFSAFSATCTHLDCIVQYRNDLKQIWCACHNGHYDLQGRNVSGPPPRPLTPFEVNILDDEVVISKPQQVS